MSLNEGGIYCIVGEYCVGVECFQRDFSGKEYVLLLHQFCNDTSTERENTEEWLFLMAGQTPIKGRYI